LNFGNRRRGNEGKCTYPLFCVFSASGGAMRGNVLIPFSALPFSALSPFLRSFSALIPFSALFSAYPLFCARRTAPDKPLAAHRPWSSAILHRLDQLSLPCSISFRSSRVSKQIFRSNDLCLRVPGEGCRVVSGAHGYEFLDRRHVHRRRFA
jgi:hypothetical protein